MIIVGIFSNSKIVGSPKVYYQQTRVSLSTARGHRYIEFNELGLVKLGFILLKTITQYQ